MFSILIGFVFLLGGASLILGPRTSPRMNSLLRRVALFTILFIVGLISFRVMKGTSTFGRGANTTPKRTPIITRVGVGDGKGRNPVCRRNRSGVRGRLLL